MNIVKALDVLGLGECTATPDHIKEMYRFKAKLLHADKGMEQVQQQPSLDIGRET